MDEPNKKCGFSNHYCCPSKGQEPKCYKKCGFYNSEVTLLRYKEEIK